MGTTNMLLREILQEIREVKAHVIPQRPSVVARAPILDPPISSVSRTSAGGGGGGGGGGGQGLSFSNILSLVSRPSESERKDLRSLLFPASKDQLVFNAALDAFISLDGSVYPSAIDEATLAPVPNLVRRIGMLKPGVRRETATPADFEFCPEDGPSAGGGLNEERNKRLSCRMSKEEQAGLSKEDKKRRAELKKLASEERKASRSPEEQAKINARVAAMQADRASKKASAGGSPSAEERQTRKRKNRRNRTRKN